MWRRPLVDAQDETCDALRGEAIVAAQAMEAAALSVPGVIMTGMNDLPDIRTVFHPDWWDRILEGGQLPAFQDWLRANGLDPRAVDQQPITIEQQDGKPVIRYTAYLLTADGRKYRDPATDGAAREERTVPLVVEPPEEFGQM